MFRQDKPTILIFTSVVTCGPCQRFEPAIKQLLAQSGVSFYVIQIDQSDNLERAKFRGLFGVGSVPTVLIYFPRTNKFVHYEETGEDARTVEAIANFVKEHASKSVHHLTVWTHVPKNVDVSHLYA